MAAGYGIPEVAHLLLRFGERANNKRHELFFLFAHTRTFFRWCNFWFGTMTAHDHFNHNYYVTPPPWLAGSSLNAEDESGQTPAQLGMTTI
jgi:hypothetical protein